MMRQVMQYYSRYGWQIFGETTTPSQDNVNGNQRGAE
jgi:hypothetical protein